MPVRIIFRGLVLFRIEKGGEESGRIVANLIDGPESAHAGMGGMSALHRHNAEVQIYTGGDLGGRFHRANDPLEYVALNRGENIYLTIPASGQYVTRDQTYKDYCPILSGIANGAAVPLERHNDADRMSRFVRNTVTVNRGTIRVRDVVAWDGGAPGAPSGPVRIDVPAEVQFLGSNVRGHMASECVIDVTDSKDVDIDSTKDNPRSGRRSGSPRNSLRVPPDTVEILITNFTPQRPKALFWSLHYGWMFEAAGFSPTTLPADKLEAFKDTARQYDPGALREDVDIFLGADGKTGFPFPYLDPSTALVGLTKLTYPAGVLVGADPWNRPLCPMGDDSTLLGP